MNYRHAFHAGNFADLVKHAALLALMTRLTTGRSSLSVIDTHAGRGLYDLAGEESRRSGEAEAGVAGLMSAADLPDAMRPLRAAVEALNPGGGARFYPGSPRLIADRLRPGDSYLACELRPEEHAALGQTLAGRPGVETLCADGYAVAATRLPERGRALVLIDPPFERGDDYARAAEALAAVAARNPAACIAVWMPIKDLETFDGFLRLASEAGAGPRLVAEARMRPLSDPMKMNGCALVIARPPADFARDLEAICGWTVRTLGEKGQAKVWRDG